MLRDAHNLDMSSLYLQSQFLPVYWLYCTLKWHAVWTMSYILSQLMKNPVPNPFAFKWEPIPWCPEGLWQRKNYICWHYMVIPDHSSQLCCTKRLHNSMNLWYISYKATPDEWVIVESYDKMWKISPLSSEDVQHATGEELRAVINSSRKKKWRGWVNTETMLSCGCAW